MLNALGDLGDFIGGIAVVVTLVYLAVQLRQNTAALRASSWQEVVSGCRKAARFRGKPKNSLAWAKGLSHYPNIPFEDMNRFNSMVTDEALFYQGVFALYESGQLDKRVYEAYLNWFASIIATPGGTQWWQKIGKPIFVQTMVDEVDTRLSEGGLHDIRNIPGLGLSGEDLTFIAEGAVSG